MEGSIRPPRHRAEPTRVAGWRHVTRPVLVRFIERLEAAFARSGRLYLMGETTQVWEGWQEWAPHVEFTADVGREDAPAFAHALQVVAEQMGITVYDESPREVIPLPAGWETRARRSEWTERPRGNGLPGGLELCHFDPYSVAIRLIARGDEPDYHVVLAYLEHGWLNEDEMNARLAELLPRFTNETIQQDPAEFRRKWKGLLQMWRAGRSVRLEEYS